MYKMKQITLFLILLLMSSKAFSMIYDNRYFPFFKRPYMKKICECMYSRVGTSFFAVSADQAMGVHDEEIRIPRIYGEYNMENIGKGLVLQGKPNPIRDEFQNINLPWWIDQKFNGQGMSFVYDQFLGKYFYVGASCLFMRLHSNFAFVFDRQESGLKLSDDQLSDIYDSMCKLHNAIGIKGHGYNQTGFGDIDAYFRVGNIWDYLYKMRYIDAGFSLGFLLPTGKKFCIDLPASLPFGGNGHYGMYGQVDLELGLRDDIRLLLLFRYSKRKSKTCNRRVPLVKEHPLFGTLIAPVDVDPGYSIAFTPQVWWEGLRKGFGLRIGYSLVYHAEDKWTLCQIPTFPGGKSDHASIDAGLANICRTSSWATDYVNLSAYYDFYDDTKDQRVAPIISLTWDWPTFFFVGKRVPKTHRISLGLDIVF